MEQESDIRQAIRQTLAEDFNLSGEELDHLLHVVETNASAFLQAIPGLLEAERWNAIVGGGEKLIGLSETLGWLELGEGAFALKEGAKQGNRQAVAGARQKLRLLLATFIKQAENKPAVALTWHVNETNHDDKPADA